MKTGTIWVGDVSERTRSHDSILGESQERDVMTETIDGFGMAWGVVSFCLAATPHALYHSSGLSKGFGEAMHIYRNRLLVSGKAS